MEILELEYKRFTNLVKALTSPPDTDIILYEAMFTRIRASYIFSEKGADVLPRFNYNICMGCMEPKNGEGDCPICGYSPDSPYLPAYLPPETFLNDRYVVGKLLRYNGESAEYIGFDTVTSSKVTIREYMPDTLCSRVKDGTALSVKQNSVAQYKAFMSEFVELNKMLAKMRTLGHINPAIDMFGDNNTGYVVFRYIEGMNLTKYLKENAGELTWDEVKKLFPPIFTTLSLVHNAGLIHRGISPDNIIVTDKKELKLIGFCVADARTANTELASEIYPGFAAPEQYSSSNWQGTWTDVYGICALLYRILTGTTPVDAMERTASDSLMNPKELNGNIPTHVSKVIMNGMNLSSELRIQTVTELVTQLFEEPEFNKKPVSATQTISIPKQHSTKGTVEEAQTKSGKPQKKRMSRHSVFIITVVCAVCVMAVIMGIVIMGLEDHSSPVIDGLPATETTFGTTAVTAEDGSMIPPPPEEMTRNTEEENPSTLPTLAVVETAPTENPTQTTLRPGATVYIMNELVGKYFDTVKNTSINDSLTIVPVYVYTEEHEKGIIFEQSIEKGSNYEKGAELTLKISMGPEEVEIPEFTGLNKKDYFDILSKMGIKYEEKPYNTQNVLNDYICWVNVDPQVEIEPGAPINLKDGEVLTVYVAVNKTASETSETTAPTETEAPDYSSAWVTTVPPVIVTEPEDSPSTDFAPVTEEPDIIITVDY